MARCRKAITLVEVLVTLGVLAVLLAIVLPAIGASRRSAETVGALADQRGRGGVLAQYIVAHRDEFPTYGIPGTNRGPLFTPDGELAVDAYWSQPGCWGLFLEWTGVVSGMWPRSLRDGATGAFDAPEDILTYGAYAPARFWKPGASQRETDHLPQKATSVRFASRKTFLLRGDPANASGRDWKYVLWFADGHGDIASEGRLRAGVPLRFWLPAGARGLTTEDGLEGRDM